MISWYYYLAFNSFIDYELLICRSEVLKLCYKSQGTASFKAQLGMKQNFLFTFCWDTRWNDNSLIPWNCQIAKLDESNQANWLFNLVQGLKTR